MSSMAWAVLAAIRCAYERSDMRFVRLDIVRSIARLAIG